jgi:hypothetical protein
MTLTSDPPHVTADPPGTLRAVAVGAAVGVVIALVVVGGALLLAGQGMSAALAIGGMAAIWGGLGFGSMFGGVRHLTKHEEH